MALIVLREVSKQYGTGEQAVRAADRVSFQIEQGEFTVILGPSGAGKSTVLNLLGGMDIPTSGSIRIGGEDIAAYDDDRLAQYRCDAVGFVFQFYNLIPALTAYQNVALIGEIVKNAMDAKEALKAVGLGERLDQFPSQLSGGEQQRVSIARALIKRPDILILDDCTSAVDVTTEAAIRAALKRFSKEILCLMISQRISSVMTADTILVLDQGRIVGMGTHSRLLRECDVYRDIYRSQIGKEVA